jgi:hypothetical protein
MASQQHPQQVQRKLREPCFWLLQLLVRHCCYKCRVQHTQGSSVDGLCSTAAVAQRHCLVLLMCLGTTVTGTDTN